MVELETTFPWQAQNRAVNQQSDGQSVVSAWRHKQPIYFFRSQLAVGMRPNWNRSINEPSNFPQLRRPRKVLFTSVVFISGQLHVTASPVAPHVQTDVQDTALQGYRGQIYNSYPGHRRHQRCGLGEL